MSARGSVSPLLFPLLSSRPATVDRLHLLFFVISVPVALIIVILFIVLYVYNDVKGQTAVLVISCVATGAAVGMTGLLILCHLTVYVSPVQQRLICRILLMVPVNALDSLIALLFSRIATIVAVIRDTYEAYVIYQFYLLLMEYLGGESRVLELWRLHGTGSTYDDSMNTMSDGRDRENIPYDEASQSSEATSTLSAPYVCHSYPQEQCGDVGNVPQRVVEPQDSEGKKEKEKEEEGPTPSMRHAFPMNLCCAPMPLNGTTLYLWKLLLTQYAILNPLLTLLIIPFYFTGHYHGGSFSAYDSYLYFATVRTISVSLALAALVYFYFATKRYMRMYSPTLKFIAIKTIVFLTFWQGVVLSALVFYGCISDSRIVAKEVAEGLQNFLICVEMYIFSIVHRWAFSDDIYIRSNNGCRHRLRLWIIRHVLSIGDVIDEAGSVVRLAPSAAEQFIRKSLSRKGRKMSTKRQSMETESANRTSAVEANAIGVDPDV